MLLNLPTQVIPKKLLFVLKQYDIFHRLSFKAGGSSPYRYWMKRLALMLKTVVALQSLAKVF